MNLKTPILEIGNEEFFIKQRLEEQKKARLQAVRRQESEHSKKRIKDYNEATIRKENIEQNAAAYTEYLRKIEERDRLLRERELAKDMMYKAQRDAIEQAEATLKAQKEKEEQMKLAQEEAIRRGKEALKKEQQERMRKEREAAQEINRKIETIKNFSTLERDQAEKYRNTETNKIDPFEDDLYKQAPGKIKSGSSVEEYMRSRHHNTLIVRHDGTSLNAYEKANAEIQRDIERRLEMMAKTAENKEKAKVRGEKAMDRVRDEKELKQMEDELREIRITDGLYKIEEGRKKDAATIEMPYTLIESRKTKQCELEKVFEDEFLHSKPIDFKEAAEVVPIQKKHEPMSMRIVEKPVKERKVKKPEAKIIVKEKEEVKEPEQHNVDQDIVKNVKVVEEESKDSESEEEKSPEQEKLQPIIEDTKQYEVDVEKSIPQQNEAITIKPEIAENIEEEKSPEKEQYKEEERIDSPIIKEEEEVKKLRDIFDKEESQLKSIESLPEHYLKPSEPQTYKSILRQTPTQERKPVLLNQFLTEESPEVKKSPESESLISSSVFTSEKSPPTETKHRELKDTPMKSELDYSPSEESMSVDSLEQKEGGSLAEQFMMKKRDVAARMEERHATTKHVPKERTKESILEMRRQMMKSTIKHEEPVAAGPKSEKYARLVAGKRPEMTKDEMLKLTNKNYEQLPEVKQKRAEDQKKKELKERIKNAKELGKVLFN